MTLSKKNALYKRNISYTTKYAAIIFSSESYMSKSESENALISQLFSLTRWIKNILPIAFVFCDKVHSLFIMSYIKSKVLCV